MTDHDSFSGKPVDNDLEVLSRLYKEAPVNTSTDEPPPSLDDAIRAAARRAVNARPQSVKKRWYARWDSPLAMAAVIVLTVSITMVLVDEQPDLAPSAVQKALIPQAATPVTTATPTPEPARPRSSFVDSAAKAHQEDVKESAPVPAREMGRRDAAPPASSGRIEADSLSRISPREPGKRALQAPAPQVESRVIAEKNAGFVADPESNSHMKKMESPAPAASSNAVAPQAAPPASPRAPAQVPPQNRADSQGQIQINVKGLAKDSLVAARVPPAPKAVDAARSDMAAAPAVFPPAPAPARSVVAPSPMEGAPAQSSITGANNQTAAAAAARPTAAGVATENQKRVIQERANESEEIRSPEEWLKHISALRKQGKTKEAENEIAKFRKRYPDYVLPVEFRN